MRILIIRHGDPDYVADSLTKKGWREAELLSHRISKLDIDEFFCSPLGRARDTASLTLKKMDRTAETCDWLREFPSKVIDPVTGQPRVVVWDMLPSFWTEDERFFDRNDWTKPDFMNNSTLPADNQAVIDGLDGILEHFGYKRFRNYYKTEQGNDKTIAFFCHFGVQCVMLGHLLNVSPMILWHGFCALPTSVTDIYTEERRKGEVYFRCHCIGDVSHLNAADEPLSSSGCFCDVYEHFDQRHD